MTNLNNTTNINWELDSFNVIRAKHELAKFIQEKNEFKGKSTPKIDAYHERRILELTEIINNN